ncbi:MAG: HU family DNA-binding protein [Bacilli bacterium]|nr:HU family DNA-binding protein [Bacilli bacterium]
MNKQELVEEVANVAKLTKKDAIAAVDAVFDVLCDRLAAGEEVKISGFANLTVKTRAERKGINPGTGETITIPASKKIAFKPSKVLKERL